MSELVVLNMFELLELFHKISSAKLQESTSNVTSPMAKPDCLFKKRLGSKPRSLLSLSTSETVTTLGRKNTKYLDRQSALLKAQPSRRTAGSEYVTLPKPHVIATTSFRDCASAASSLRGHRSIAAAAAVTTNGPDANRNMVKPSGEGPDGDASRSCEMSNKPNRGWLHPDNQIAELGVYYEVRYIGSLEVNTSMKVLDFETRSFVAKECITRICEAAGLKTADRKRKTDKKIIRMLGDKPKMEHAGADVQLVITSNCLELRNMESNEVIAVHDMPNISFASGGDGDTLDFVAYVAKDSSEYRACYVLECGGKLAQDVITTIGQAFELRFKEYLQNNSRPAEGVTQRYRVEGSSHVAKASPNVGIGDDPVYYNDLPGKVPPESATGINSSSSGLSVKPDLYAGLFTNHHSSSAPKDLSPNLIDLNSEPASPNPFSSRPCPEYANDAMCNTATLPMGGNTLLDTANLRELLLQKDPFDMQPFEASLPTATMNHNSVTRSKTLSPINVQNLYKEVWFHGPISRKEAESLLQRDGEFLVRESLGSPGQFVLTGMQSGIRKHLLLVDPEGVVRTKDKTFESVSHLVNYHRNNGLPIISAESALVLRHPVHKKC